MPKIVEDMAATTGDTLQWDMEAPGGFSFLGHWVVNPPATKDKIKKGGWDYVVLQDRSVNPCIPEKDVKTVMYKYAHRFDSLINTTSPCVETVFYMTWGRKEGDSFLCDHYTTNFNWTNFCTYQSMDSTIRARYMKVADSDDAVISPAGAVWRYIRAHNPNIELYDPDESHPSAAGSYAVACSFYTALFKKDPTNIGYDFSLSSADAAAIRQAAKKVVYDSMLYWHIGQYKTTSLFKYSINAKTVTFTSAAFNADKLEWHFGDGQTDTTGTIAHTYSQFGAYTAMLIATDTTSGCSDTTYAQINLFPAGVSSFEDRGLKIYPNPGNGLFTVQLADEPQKVKVLNIYGQAVHTAIAQGLYHLDLRKYPKGVYTLSVLTEVDVSSSRLVIE